MRILFIGGLFSNSMEEEIKNNTKRGSVQYAAKQFQESIIKGLSGINEVHLDVLAASFVGTYPNEFRRFYYKPVRSEVIDEVRYTFVSFFNVWGVRNLFRFHSLKKELKEFINSSDQHKIIMVYSPHTPFLQAAVYAKRKDPSIKICLIVPDLPEFMNLSQKIPFYYKILKKFDIKVLYSLTKHVDSYVLITELMKDKIPINHKPYIVIEGIIDIENKVSINKECSTGIRTFAYTGTLNERFGVLELAHAFMQLPDRNLRLVICGLGDATEKIEHLSHVDSRIIFKGQVSNQEALEIQSVSTVLVNPRRDTEEYTKYSFPYKTMEYLSSGRPMIAYKLHGIPDEYDPYIYYVDSDSENPLKDTMSSVISKDLNELTLKGSLAKTFIKENKNSSLAAQKMICMFKKLY